MAENDGLTTDESGQSVLEGSLQTEQEVTEADAPGNEAECEGCGKELPKWTEQLPKEYRESVADYESYRDFAKAAVEALSSKDRSVVLPGEEADESAWGEFWASVGRPDKPDGYELPEDGDKELVTGFRAAAHTAGLTKSQAKKLLEWYTGETTKRFEATKQAREASKKEAVDTLKEEWKQDYDANMQYVARFARQFGNKDAATEIKRLGIGNNVTLIKMFAQAGRALAGDSLVEGDSSGGEKERGHFQYPWMREAYPEKTE